MVLNMFFGPVLNAASGLATTVQGALMQFSGNVLVAVKPQIVKRYASNDITGMVSLVYSSIRLCLLLVLLISLPFIFEIHFILSLWLKEVPNYTAIFCVIAICANIISAYSQIIYASIQATGNLMKSSIYRSSLYLITPVLLYILYKAGYLNPALSFGLIFIMLVAISIINIILLSKQIPSFKLKQFIIDAGKVMLMIGVDLALLKVLSDSFDEGFLRLCLSFISSSIVLLAGFYFVVFHKEERQFIVSTLTRIIKRLVSSRG